MNSKKNFLTALLYVLFIGTLNAMIGINVSGVDITVTDPAELGYCGRAWSDGSYSKCGTDTTLFKMRFYVNGKKRTQMCRCNDAGDWPTSVDEGGYVDWASFKKQYTSYEIQNIRDQQNGKALVDILFKTQNGVRNQNNYRLVGNFQDIMCKNVEVEVDYYENETRTEEKKGVETGSINIEGITSIASVEDAEQNYGGIYEANNKNVTVNFLHNLKQNPSSVFTTNINYSGDGVTSGTTSIAQSETKTITGSKTTDIPLIASDETTGICQNISFSSKTWTYKYNQLVSRTYRVRYSYNGVKLEETLISENLLGSPYIDQSSLASVGDSGSSSEACASTYRPWNFQVALIENKSGESETVYVGESITPSFKININKNNRDFPITDIPNATVTICAGAENNEECTTDHGTIHKDRMDTDTTYSFYNQDSYNLIKTGKESIVPDVPAGSSYCVSISVAPNNSGNGYYSDFNWNAQSIKRCYTVTKKPTVQVWGGNVVSGGMIQSSITKKAFGTFGSWGELAVVAEDKIDGFASGASLAEGGEVGGVFSKFTTLTLANTITSNIQLGGNFNVSNDKTLKDRNTIIEKIKAAEYVSELPDSPVTGRVYVYKEGDLYIGKNIEYLEENTSLTDMPKVLIYATRNIYIDCNVARIDAIMVAGGTVNTCASSDGSSPDIDAHARSNQLVINGMIIAEKLVLNRTYGAGVGIEASDVPAEIINYDPLIEVMFSDKIDSNDLTGLNVVYTHENAPRY